MSKSLGNITPPTPLIDKYGIDVVRYFLLRDGGLENDAEFGGEYGVARRHRELAGQLGNLVMRCSGGVVNPGGVIPLSPGAGGVGEAEGVLVDMLKGLRGEKIETITTFFSCFSFLSFLLKEWSVKRERRVAIVFMSNLFKITQTRSHSTSKPFSTAKVSNAFLIQFTRQTDIGTNPNPGS